MGVLLPSPRPRGPGRGFRSAGEPTSQASTLTALGLVTMASDSSVPDRWEAMSTNAKAIQWNTVQGSTRLTYETGWRCWQEWAELFGTDPLLRGRPRGWLQADLDIPFEVASLLVFSHVLGTHRQVAES